MNNLSTLLFVLCLFHMCSVYCPLSFVFVCSTLFVIGCLAVDFTLLNKNYYYHYHHHHYHHHYH